MTRLPRLIGRSRDLEVLVDSDDIREAGSSYGYVNKYAARELALETKRVY
jgi:hypothetical protein